MDDINMSMSSIAEATYDTQIDDSYSDMNLSGVSDLEHAKVFTQRPYKGRKSLDHLSEN